MVNDNESEEEVREIKFRAWGKDLKCMCYQGEPDCETLQSFIFHWGDEDLMQYTGLRDKNGKEIYERDIVRDKSRPDKICEVIWNESDAQFLARDNSAHHYEWFLHENPFEVIGNVYENPELLEVQE